MIVTRAIMEKHDPDRYSNLFYIMLVVGIIGVIGFIFVALGAFSSGF